MIKGDNVEETKKLIFTDFGMSLLTALIALGIAFFLGYQTGYENGYDVGYAEGKTVGFRSALFDFKIMEKPDN